MRDPIPKAINRSERLDLRITQETREELEQIADDRGTTVAHVARSLLEWALRELAKHT